MRLAVVLALLVLGCGEAEECFSQKTITIPVARDGHAATFNGPLVIDGIQCHNESTETPIGVGVDDHATLLLLGAASTGGLSVKIYADSETIFGPVFVPAAAGYGCTVSYRAARAFVF